MDLQTFLSKLTKRYKWKLREDGSIRTIKNDCCPLSAVANTKLRKRRYVCEIFYPIQEIGIDVDLGNQIAYAADNMMDSDKEIIAIRHKLLVACGLQ